ncbi:MAG: hypothetical protein M3Z30_08165 [Gemmatimonadota bacterium]|nr:hypothetical protein [Gemmatimonadota bacterium]
MKSFSLPHRVAEIVIVTTLIAAQHGCRDVPTAPSNLRAINAADAINAPGEPSSAETIFLAPLGPRKHPRGVLDTTLAPNVSICRLEGDFCGRDTVAVFSSDLTAGADQRVELSERAFSVRWIVKDLRPDTTVAYRISVTVRDTLTGFTDLKLVSDSYVPPPSDTARFAFVGERNRLNVRFQIFVPPVTLVVIAEPGVHGSITAGTYSVRRGERFSYDFAADSGYRNALVTLDQNPVPRRSSVVMNESHVLIASADREVTVRPSDEWILRDARALLRAANKVRSAQLMLTRIGEISDTTGIAERLRNVEMTLLQRPADAERMDALDAALAGHVFEAGSGVGSAANPGPGGGGGGIATALLVPGRNPPLAQLRAAASVTTPGGVNAEPVTIAYVNGILTTPFGALFAAHHVSRIARAARWSASVPFDVKLMYNRSAMAAETSIEDRCILDLGIKGDWLGLNSLPVDVARCLSTTQAGALSVLTDLLEAGTQLSNVLKRVMSTRPSDVDSVASFARALRDGGQHVVFVMHSQGNLITQQALSLLAVRGQYAQSRDTTCISGVALASPTSHSWPISSRHLSGLAVEGDVILGLGQNDFPRVSTPLSDSARIAMSGSFAARVAGILSASRIRWALRLHGAVDSYLTPPVMRERVEQALVASYHGCALGDVRIAPRLLQLRTGETGSFGASMWDMTGSPLDGWRGIRWQAESESDWQRAVQFNGAGLANARYVGGTSVSASTRSFSGSAGVEVSPAPMRVSVKETLSARWVVLGISTSDEVPIPVFDIPETSWGGGSCREMAVFTSNGRTGSFSKQCLGTYTITTDPVANADTYAATFFETGGTTALMTETSHTGTIVGSISGPEPAFDPLPGPVPIDRIVLTASDAAGHLLSRGVACLRGCKGWPPEQ